MVGMRLRGPIMHGKKKEIGRSFCECVQLKRERGGEGKFQRIGEWGEAERRGGKIVRGEEMESCR